MAFGGGGDDKKQTTVQSNAPWAPLQAPLQGAISDATKLYKAGGFAKANEFYPGSTVAGIAPETAQAWSGIAGRAANGSPLNGAASDYLTSVLNGDYLDAGNPYQQQLNDSITASVLPTVESRYSAGGRYGSPAMGMDLTKTLGEAIAPSVYGNYQQERGNQQAAMQFAPELAQQDYVDLGQLLDVGSQRQNYQQRQINADQERFQAQQQQQLKAIQQYMELLGGNYGGSSSTTAPVQDTSGDVWGQALGTGAGLAAMYAMSKWL